MTGLGFCFVFILFVLGVQTQMEREKGRPRLAEPETQPRPALGPGSCPDGAVLLPGALTSGLPSPAHTVPSPQERKLWHARALLAGGSVFALNAASYCRRPGKSSSKPGIPDGEEQEGGPSPRHNRKVGVGPEPATQPPPRPTKPGLQTAGLCVL